MPTRTAHTAWTGTLQEGSGQVELTSSKLATFDVSFPARAAEEAERRHQPRGADRGRPLVVLRHAAVRQHRARGRYAGRPGRPGRRLLGPRPRRWFPPDRHHPDRPR